MKIDERKCADERVHSLPFAVPTCPRIPSLALHLHLRTIVLCNSDAPGALGPYSQAIKAGPFVFLSGNIPAIPASGEIVEGGVEAQTVSILYCTLIGTC